MSNVSKQSHKTDGAEKAPAGRKERFLQSLWLWGYRRRRPALYMTVLLFVFALTYYTAFWIRFDGNIPEDYYSAFLRTVAWVVAVKCLIFGGFRIYRGWSRFVTFYDMSQLAKAAFSSFLVNIIIWHFLTQTQLVPRSVWILDCCFTLLFIGGLRGGYRLLRERQWRQLFFLRKGVRPALIVGVNAGSEALLRAINKNHSLGYDVRGFIDVKESRVGTSIAGVTILGVLESIPQWIKRLQTKELLVVTGSLSGRQVRQVMKVARRHKIQIRVLPSYEQVIEGDVAIRPRDVSIDDLLQREPVALDMDNLREWLDGRTLMVTGSAGSIGSEICRQLLAFSPRRIILVDRWETGQFFLERELADAVEAGIVDVRIADILDLDNLQRLMRECQPNIVFHAAAYKHVPLMESHPAEAAKNIVQATKNVALTAHETGVDALVMVSTDKAVNPTSVMGACKRAAELYVQDLAGRSPTRFVTVRFGNVLDSSGSVVQVFKQQIADGGPITVTDPQMKRYFMTIPEASRLVIQAGAIGGDGEIMVLDMGQPVRIVDLAKDMIRLSGLQEDTDIEIEFIGLRPGEKMTEQLHCDSEIQLPTRHPKIMVAGGTPTVRIAPEIAITRLLQLAKNRPEMVQSYLAQFVPGYRIPAAELQNEAA